MAIWNTTRSLLASVVLTAGIAHAGATHAQPLVPGSPQTSTLEIRGILDGAHDAVNVSDVTVSINGAAVSVAEDGNFAGKIAAQATYQLVIDGPGIFRMVQTFAGAEILDAACMCLTVPAIELVARMPGRVELFFGGDTMAGRRYIKPSRKERRLIDPVNPAADMDRLLASISPYMSSADFASVNLETVLIDSVPKETSPKRITFSTPTALAPALKRAGVDYVSLGNNHIYDFHEEGVATTMAALDAAGVAHSGAGHSEAEAEAARRLDIGGKAYGMLGFVGWTGSWTPTQTALDDKGGAAYGSRGQIRRSVRREVREGAIPIVQYHGGSEYSDRPGNTTSGRLREAIDNGAPLAIAHHPHVTQGLEVYNGGLIAWSIGNFMFDQDFIETQVSFGLKVWLDDGRFLRAEAIPLAISDYRPIPAMGAMREEALRRLASLSADAGTQISFSGGHAVVRADQSAHPEPGPCREGRGDTLAALAPLCPTDTYLRLGRNITPHGDFETSVYEGALDRVWAAHNSQVTFVDTPHGRHVRLRQELADKPIHFYPQSYLRDLDGGDYVVEAMIRAPQGARVELVVKDRPSKAVRGVARWRGELLGSTLVMPSDSWRKIRFRFSGSIKADGKPRQFRPALRILPRGASGGLEYVEIDKVAVIELQRDSSDTVAAPDWKWTHIADRLRIDR